MTNRKVKVQRIAAITMQLPSEYHDGYELKSTFRTPRGAAEAWARHRAWIWMKTQITPGVATPSWTKAHNARVKRLVRKAYPIFKKLFE